MGGGDLNLKKSWHPSTLRNIERVWKAEQKHEAEQQKIEQLQKELAEERAREEIQTFAEDQGVVKKKEEKLDWMYQGPAAMLNREEFLLGRKIDNTFEKMQLLETGKVCEEESTEVFSSQDLTGTATVDLANKIREDPLFNIMKKEKEQRKNLLTNPVKMKQLQQMLKASLTEKSKKKKKKSKKKNHRASDSDDDTYEKKKHRKRKSSSDSDHDKKQIKEFKTHIKRKSYDDFLSESEDSSHECSQKKNRKHSRSPIRNRDSIYSSNRNSHSGRHHETNHYKERYNNYQERYNQERYNSKHESSPDRHIERHFKRDYSPRRQREDSPQRYNQRYKKDSNYADKRPQNSSSQRKIDKEEAERLLKEMQENAKWRERQRKKNTDRYREEDEKEDNIKRVDAADFLKPMLSKAAGKSLENRVKQKIFSIQRNSAAMDKNFARRE